MRDRLCLCTPLPLLAGLLLLAGSLAWAGDLQKQGFGKSSGGVAMRARKVKRPTGASPLLQPIQVEIRAVDGKAVVIADPFSPKLLWKTELGKALPEGLLALAPRSPLDRSGLTVKPGKPLTWTVSLLRTLSKAPETLRVRASLSHVGTIRHGAPPLASDTLQLELPLPKSLEKKHVAAGWTRGTTLVYRQFEGLYGWRMLDVQPDGEATVFRSNINGDLPARKSSTNLPSGTFTARLTSTETKALGALLLTQQVWTLDDLPKRMLRPDESSATFTLIAGEAAMFARYPKAEARKANRGYATLESGLDGLMQRLVKRALKGKR